MNIVFSMYTRYPVINNWVIRIIYSKYNIIRYKNSSGEQLTVSRDFHSINDELEETKEDLLRLKKELESTKVLLNTANSRLLVCSSPIGTRKIEESVEDDSSPVEFRVSYSPERKEALNAFKKNPLLPDIQTTYLSSIAVPLYLLVPHQQELSINLILDSRSMEDSEEVWNSWSKHFEYSDFLQDEEYVKKFVITLLTSVDWSPEIMVTRMSHFALIIHHVIKIETLKEHSMPKEISKVLFSTVDEKV